MVRVVCSGMGIITLPQAMCCLALAGTKKQKQGRQKDPEVDGAWHGMPCDVRHVAWRGGPSGAAVWPPSMGVWPSPLPPARTQAGSKGSKAQRGLPRAAGQIQKRSMLVARRQQLLAAEEEEVMWGWHVRLPCGDVLWRCHVGMPCGAIALSHFAVSGWLQELPKAKVVNQLDDSTRAIMKRLKSKQDKEKQSITEAKLSSIMDRLHR